MKLKPSYIIITLYDILERSKFEDGICWSENGKSFIISKIKEFQQNILNQHFNTQKLDSFLRLLRLYGFNMRKNQQNYKEYYHPLFIKGNYLQLYQIKRKKKQKLDKQLEENIIVLNENKELQNQLTQLKINQNNLLIQIRKQFEIQLLLTNIINKLIDFFSNTIYREKKMKFGKRVLCQFYSLIFGYIPQHQIEFLNCLIDKEMLDTIETIQYNYSPLLFSSFH